VCQWRGGVVVVVVVVAGLVAGFEETEVLPLSCRWWLVDRYWPGHLWLVGLRCRWKVDDWAGWLALPDARVMVVWVEAEVVDDEDVLAVFTDAVTIVGGGGDSA